MGLYGRTLFCATTPAVGSVTTLINTSTPKYTHHPPQPYPPHSHIPLYYYVGQGDRESSEGERKTGRPNQYHRHSVNITQTFSRCPSPPHQSNVHPRPTNTKRRFLSSSEKCDMEWKLNYMNEDLWKQWRLVFSGNSEGWPDLCGEQRGGGRQK